MDPTGSHSNDERLRELQEAQAFADHRADQISGEVLALSRRLEELTRRLASLERRLDEALHPQDGGEEDQPPEPTPGS